MEVKRYSKRLLCSSCVFEENLRIGEASAHASANSTTKVSACGKKGT